MENDDHHCPECGVETLKGYCSYDCFAAAVERDTKDRAAWRAGEGEAW